MFCFDGDRAGRAAAWRALENAVGEVKQGRQVRFLFLPDGHDPDTLVQQEGAEAFEARLASALPLADYFIRELSSRVDMASVDGRAKLVELARPLVRRIPSDVYRELLVTQLADAVRMSATRLAELLGSDEPGPPGRGESRPAAPPLRRASGPAHASGRGNLVRQAITLLVNFPVAATRVSHDEIDAVGTSDRPGMALLAELLAQIREDPPPGMSALLERWRDRPEHGWLSKLAVMECLVADAEQASSELKSALTRLIHEESPAHRLDALLAKARDDTLTDQEKLELQGLLRAKGRSGRATPGP